MTAVHTALARQVTIHLLDKGTMNLANYLYLVFVRLIVLIGRVLIAITMQFSCARNKPINAKAPGLNCLCYSFFPTENAPTALQ